MDRRGMMILSALVLIASIIAGVMVLGNLAQPFNGVVLLVALGLAIVLAVLVLAGADQAATLVAEFGAEGVVVSVPWQGRPVRVEKLALESIEVVKGMRTAAKRDSAAHHADQWGHRAVINFQIVESATGRPIVEFDPPFSLQVGYTSGDIAKAGGDLNQIELGFQLDTGELFVFHRDKHKYTVNPDAKLPGDYLGALEARVPRWGDPLVMVGP